MNLPFVSSDKERNLISDFELEVGSFEQVIDRVRNEKALAVALVADAAQIGRVDGAIGFVHFGLRGHDPRHFLVAQHFRRDGAARKSNYLVDK